MAVEELAYRDHLVRLMNGGGGVSLYWGPLSNPCKLETIGISGPLSPSIGPHNKSVFQQNIAGSPKTRGAPLVKSGTLDHCSDADAKITAHRGPRTMFDGQEPIKQDCVTSA